MKTTIPREKLTSLIEIIAKSLINEINKPEQKIIKYIYPENYRDVKNYIRIAKTNIEGEFVVVWISNGKMNDEKSYYTDNKVDATQTFDRMKLEVDKENQKLGEETGTSAAAPISGKLPINKRIMEDEDKIPGKFVNRGDVKLEGGIDQPLADKIANYHWDIMQSMGKDERGVFNYKTRGDRYCCSVGLLNGQPAILSVTTRPGRLNLLVGNDEIFGGENLSETTTGDVGGYNIPAAFSRRDGGSKKALDGSKSLGYELTPAGKEEFARHPDRMY